MGQLTLLLRALSAGIAELVGLDTAAHENAADHAGGCSIGHHDGRVGFISTSSVAEKPIIVSDFWPAHASRRGNGRLHGSVAPGVSRLVAFLAPRDSSTAFASTAAPLPQTLGHTTPRGLITMRNAFVQEEAPRPNESEPAKFIYSVNRSSQELYDDVFRLASKVGAERLALDKAMAGYKQKLQNECADYMRHRSEIYTLAGRHCGAAQGRLQAAEVDDANGPRGCLHTPPSGTGVEHGTPYQLPEQRCTHSERQLLCTTRLKELSRGAPAPGEAPDAPSMDAQVRKWCHPAQVVETPRVTRDLAMGMPETS
eukprot:TRINITY_DN16153_c0_g1_i4.p1 TRINITY_DN16153_c0_g1~~TRINITY_DN16153_c0_g1_i4.p1  ORF type:complete len:312 (-),score=44.52 TRINITY_DN16153_c0_g1_i4:142-1077(-)